MKYLIDKMFEYVMSSTYKSSMISYAKYNTDDIFFQHIADEYNFYKQISKIINTNNFKEFCNDGMQSIYLKYNRKDKLKIILNEKIQ